jgi:hypothetical protein
MGLMQEQYQPIVLAVDTPANNITCAGLGGFACKTAGNITVTDATGDIIDQFPVEAGVYYPFPFACSGSIDITPAGGASGTFGVAG